MSRCHFHIFWQLWLHFFPLHPLVMFAQAGQSTGGAKDDRLLHYIICTCSCSACSSNCDATHLHKHHVVNKQVYPVLPGVITRCVLYCAHCYTDVQGCQEQSKLIFAPLTLDSCYGHCRRALVLLQLHSSGDTSAMSNTVEQTKVNDSFAGTQAANDANPRHFLNPRASHCCH